MKLDKSSLNIFSHHKDAFQYAIVCMKKYNKNTVTNGECLEINVNFTMLHIAFDLSISKHFLLL